MRDEIAFSRVFSTLRRSSMADRPPEEIFERRHDSSECRAEIRRTSRELHGKSFTNGDLLIDKLHCQRITSTEIESFLSITLSSVERLYRDGSLDTRHFQLDLKISF